jgi:phosphatidylinositol 4-kinase B
MQHKTKKTSKVINKRSFVNETSKA